MTDDKSRRSVEGLQKKLDQLMMQNALLKKRLETVPAVPAVPVPAVPAILPESNTIGSLSRILDRCESVSFTRKRVGEGSGQTWQLDVSVQIPARGHDVSMSHVVNNDEVNSLKTDGLADQLTECIRRLSALIVG